MSSENYSNYFSPCEKESYRLPSTTIQLLGNKANCYGYFTKKIIC